MILVDSFNQANEIFYPLNYHSFLFLTFLSYSSLFIFRHISYLFLKDYDGATLLHLSIMCACAYIHKYISNICVLGTDTSVNKKDNYLRLHGVAIPVGAT